MSDSTSKGERTRETFVRAVHDMYDFLKSSQNATEACVRSISLGEEIGSLVPVSSFHVQDNDLIARLAEARAANEASFPTRFIVTHEGTRAWLENGVLGVPDRMLFLVVDRFGKTVGHVGLANTSTTDALSLELDNIMRLDAGSAPGIMAHACRCLIEWARTVLWAELIVLRVLADNVRAISFYENLGFVESGRQRLRQIDVEGGTRLEPMEGPGEPDNEFIVMASDLMTKPRPEGLILTAGPSISQKEAGFAWDAARAGWNSNWSGYLTKFERAFADYVGMEYAIATSSCTGALHIALAALGVGPGDEVIVPDATWVASATAVLYLGATPVFVDVSLDSWCMDPDELEAAITPKTKAIIPVHMYGHPARMDAIMAIARTHGIPVVEDAAPSIGAECSGIKTGSFGDFSAFSFQGAKMLVTGEGGILLTNNANLYASAKKIWDHGRSDIRDFWIDRLGFKYKMSNVQAALGLGQIERADEHVEAKRRIFRWYEEGLSGVRGFSLQHEATWAYSNYWMTSGILTKDADITRDELRRRLRDRDVDSRPVFPAISQYPIWPTESKPKPNAYFIGEYGLNLPSGVCLTKTQVQHVCQALRESLGEY